jgi:hypothetical protein
LSPRGLSHVAHWTGFNVSALSALMTAVAAMTSANWRKICPVMPGRKAAGRKTATSARVIPITGP